MSAERKPFIDGPGGAGMLVRTGHQPTGTLGYVLRLGEAFYVLGFTSDEHERGAVIELRLTVTQEGSPDWPSITPTLGQMFATFKTTADNEEAAWILDLLARALANGLPVELGDQGVQRWGSRTMGRGMGITVEPDGYRLTAKGRADLAEWKGKAA